MSAVRRSLRRATVPGASALLSLTLLAAGMAATSARYSISEVTSAGGRAAYPNFLTDSGQIAGSANTKLPTDSSVPTHEAYYRSASGDIHTYSFGAGTESYGLGVNSAGLLVGDVYPDGEVHQGEDNFQKEECAHRGERTGERRDTWRCQKIEEFQERIPFKK